VWFQFSGSDPHCVLREILSGNQYTEFESVVNPRWYVGFDRSGRKLDGRRRRYQKDDVIKTRTNATSGHSNRPITDDSAMAVNRERRNVSIRDVSKGSSSGAVLRNRSKINNTSSTAIGGGAGQVKSLAPPSKRATARTQQRWNNDKCYQFVPISETNAGSRRVEGSASFGQVVARSMGDSHKLHSNTNSQQLYQHQNKRQQQQQRSEGPT